MKVLYSLYALFAVFLLGLGGFSAHPAHAQRARHIEPSLAFETRTPAPGQTVTVAIRMQPERGWHGYWSNPGEAGLPVEARWQTPAGVTVSPLRHPAPQLLNVQGIASYVHEGPFTLLATMRVPDNLSSDSALPVQVALNWLVCSDTLCVPERATLSANLRIGSGQPDAAGAKIVAAGERSLPRKLDGITFTREDKNWVFSLPGSAGDKVHIFPEDEGWFAAGAPQTASPMGDRLLLRISATGTKPGSEFRGVLTNGKSSYAIKAQNTVGLTVRSEASPSAADVSITEPVSPSGESQKMPSSLSRITDYSSETLTKTSSQSGNVIWFALLGALIGGLLLNLMPCVFPILSLKALSIAKSGGNPRAARAEGLGYAAGTVAAALILGGLLIGLRAVGMEIGWSFQLQSPGVILVLLLLTGTIALNLAGLFELPMPAFAARGSSRGGWIGGFSTGALAAIIGMPCSGPFMAGALGAALVLPAPLALGVFAMLGLGMALPFFVVAFVPAIQQRLPRPGAWMEKLRKVLSIPMFATALALTWLLGRQTGVDGMASGLIVAAIFAISLWWLGLRQRRGAKGWATMAPAALALTVMLAIGMPVAPSGALYTSRNLNEADHEPFSTERLAQLRNEGKPVFVDFTADWCLVCKVNERVAIDTNLTRKAFADAGVVTLTGDWTRQDPEISKFLAKHGRNSIPFYQFYAPGQQMEILPQVLTPQTLAEKARALPVTIARIP